MGEVLLDCFPDGSVLGGAPLNVAWNLRGLGLDPLLVTSVGNDDHGHSVIRAMTDWSLDPAGIQIDPQHPTGRVDIHLDSGEPTYTFWDDVAFDHIRLPAEKLLSQHFGLLYHGSLAMRSPESMQTILRIRDVVTCPVFVDINIRQPYFDNAWIAPLLTNADHVKLNTDELQRITDYVGHCKTSDSAGSAEQDRLVEKAKTIQQTFGVKTVWITRGSQGAGCLLADGSWIQCQAPPVDNMKDSVGAGDAFAARVMLGILANASTRDSLQRASEFAARVCGLTGATTVDRDFYSK